MNNDTLLQNIIPMRARGFGSPGGEASHRYPGLFGVEIELEDTNITQSPIGWDVHQDGSLRNGIELVTYPPMGGDQLVTALDAFYDEGYSYNASPRTSTHIHIDLSQETVGTLRSMVALVYVLETGLYDIIGEDRKWAGYSMPLYEAGSARLRNILSPLTTQADFVRAVNSGRNTDRYYGLNVSSLSRHGTAEFRYFPGGPTREELEMWLDLVVGIKRLAKSVTLDQLDQTISNGLQLFELFETQLPASFMARMREVVTAEELFNTLQEVLAMVEQDNSMQRREQLVFLSTHLVEYFCNNFVRTEEGKEYLRRAASELEVTTTGEWQTVLNTAVNMGNGDEFVPSDPLRMRLSDLHSMANLTTEWLSSPTLFQSSDEDDVEEDEDSDESW